MRLIGCEMMADHEMSVGRELVHKSVREAHTHRHPYNVPGEVSLVQEDMWAHRHHEGSARYKGQPVMGYMF